MKHFSGSCPSFLSICFMWITFFHVSLSLSLWRWNKKAKLPSPPPHMLPLAGGSIVGQARTQMRGLGGAQRGGPRGGCGRGLSISATQQQRGDSCTTARVWGFIRIRSEVLMQTYLFPSAQLQGFVFECCSLFLSKRDVSVTSSPPENISHDAAVQWTPTCWYAVTHRWCWRISKVAH